jgi:hypothetical protein
VRYYSIVISDQNTGEVLVPNLKGRPGFSRVAAGPMVSTYTSLVGDSPSLKGSTAPGAQNIELDIPVALLATPAGSAYVRIWGVSLQEIAQANNLNNLTVKVYGGMAKGLPLANPAQSGLLVEGSIQQAFGNWQDVNMTLDLVINASYGTASAPANVVLNWKRGQKLADAIDSALSAAFPAYKRNINISPNLVLTADAEPGFYQTAAQFAQYLNQVSRSIIGGSYNGVNVLLTQSTFNVFDGTSQTNPTKLAFTDLIGQPTWIGPNQVHVECVMRADINVGDYVSMPATPLINTTSGALSQYAQIRQGSAFKGTFMVTYMRHVGNYRQPPGNAWITTYDLVQMTDV